MNFNVTIRQGGTVVKTARVDLGEKTPVRLGGPLAADGAPFPANHELLVQKGSDLILQLAPGMNATLVRGATKLTLDDLRAKNYVRKQGDVEVLKVPEGTRVEISAGDWAVVVDPAPARATAAPAASARPAAPVAGTPGGTGAVAGDVWAAYRIFSDTSRMTTFMKVVVVSLIAHLAIMLFFSTRVIVRDPFQVEDVPERFAKFIAPPVEEAPAPKESGASEQQQQAKQETVEEEPAGGSDAPKESKTADMSAEQKAEVRERVKNKGLLGIIGSKSSGGGAIADVLSSGNLGSDLDKALDDMKGSGLGVAKTGDDLKAGGTRGGSGYGTADIGKLDTGGPGKGVGLGDKKKTAVTSDIQTGDFSSSGSLDSSAIASVVKQKLSGIKYCYEKELKNNPNLAGKVVVNFTIGADGSVTNYRVDNSTLNNTNVEQCILRMVRRWKFPAPAGGSVNVSYPFIFTATG